MKKKRFSAGAAFTEHIKTERLSKFSGEKQSKKERGFRGFLLPTILLVLGSILFFRLTFLQLIQGNYYRNLSDTNRVRTTIIHAPRGVIFDRNNTPLVFNTAGFRKTIKGKTIFLSQDEAINLLAKNDTSLAIDSLRDYPYKDGLAHVIGYVGQISQEELRSPDFSDYKSGDIVGKMGLEEEYEKILRGTDGQQLYEVDATGKEIRKLGQTDPLPGQDITITIDAKLQKTAYDAMRDVKKGALVVSTPKGEILALVSKPSFDPNLFTQGKEYKIATDSAYTNAQQVLLDGDGQPLLNRAIAGQYPPGSTFKLVNAAAGLEDKVINKDFTIDDTGVVKIGEFSFANWYFTQYGRTEGPVNIVKAIKRSNDIFFYKLADMLGVDRLSAFAKEHFGLGSNLGIDLPGEEPGLVPTKAWKEATFHEQWYLGDNYHYGIGQGFLLTTPLQVNAWTQAIVNGGVLYRPHLLLDSDTNKFKITKTPFLAQQSLDLIREGMVEACNPGGVAWPLFDFKVKNPRLAIDGQNIVQAASSSANMRHVVLACKTGTAEHGDVTVTEPHAWITVAAPAYKPQIIVTVLSESSGEGSNVAAPIAKKVLEEWFSR